MNWTKRDLHTQSRNESYLAEIGMRRFIVCQQYDSMWFAWTYTILQTGRTTPAIDLLTANPPTHRALFGTAKAAMTAADAWVLNRQETTDEDT